jgi:hypothetical protein
LPLFSSYWANPPPHRLKALRTAIELAERSAAEGQPVKGLPDAQKKALSTAGAAMETKSEGNPRGESRPANTQLGAIASYIAQAAERAAVAAVDENDSMLAAAGACAAAACAAYPAERGDIMDSLTQDFAKLLRAAQRGKWTDQTAIPLEIWQTL